jgi:hypothetical protein
MSGALMINNEFANNMANIVANNITNDGVHNIAYILITNNIALII